MRLYEAKKINEAVVQSGMVEETICYCLSMITQLKVWHWQTKEYAAHKALDGFHGTLVTTTDQIAEFYLGTGGEFKFSQKQTIENFVSVEDTIKKLKTFREYMVKTQLELMKDENSDLHAVGDTVLDVVKETDKLLYLLTLK